MIRVTKVLLQTFCTTSDTSEIDKTLFVVECRNEDKRGLQSNVTQIKTKGLKNVCGRRTLGEIQMRD